MAKFGSLQKVASQIGTLKGGGLSVKLKLQGLLLVVSLGAILAIGFVAWAMARETLQKDARAHLTSVRSSKSNQIEAYFKTLRSHVQSLSEDRMVVSAMVEFNRAFRGLNDEHISTKWETTLDTYYQQEFFPKLSKNLSGTPNLETYRPTSQVAKYLQYYYVANNPNPLGEKHKLVDAEDGSDYSEVHTQYHEIFHRLIEDFGYYDLFLIDYKTGDIVYSVFKETDFATNLDFGPYRKSNLAAAIEAVRENPERRSIQLVDFKPYRPSYMAPAAFFAGPIYNGPHIVGILAVQLPIAEINNVLTGFEDWQGEGLGKTGETYLLGSDLLMRSMSRFLIEDGKKYQKALRANGISEDEVKLIDRLGTSVLLQRLNTDAARAAVKGEEGFDISRGYRGTTVLSSYGPIEIKGVDWAIVAERELGEMYEPVFVLQRNLLIVTAILMVLISFVAIAATQIITGPIAILSRAIRNLEAEDGAVQIDLNTQDEFGELAQSLAQVLQRNREQEKALSQKDRENEALLLNILPAQVVERLRKGETQIADLIPQATVLSAQVEGLQALVEREETQQAFNTFNDLFNLFDEEAVKHDIERLRNIGECYMAVCGVTSKRLDHAKRVLDFALRMLTILQGFNHQHQTELTLRIGIHTAEVMAGVIGTKTLLFYNLWGEATAIAERLSWLADSNTVLVTQAVYDYLHDSHAFEPGDAIAVDGDRSVKTWVATIGMERGVA